MILLYPRGLAAGFLLQSWEHLVELRGLIMISLPQLLVKTFKYKAVFEELKQTNKKDVYELI